MNQTARYAVAVELKPGSRWKSAVCEAEIIVVRPPDGEGHLECGGHAMLPAEVEKPGGLQLDPDHAGGVALGKRFSEPDSGIEVLCTRAGRGSLSLSGTSLEQKVAKPLPSSD